MKALRNKYTVNRIIKALIGSLVLLLTLPAISAIKQVSSPSELTAALLSASKDTEIQLLEGVYKGNFKIAKPVTINCQNHATLDGQHQHDTLRITAPNVTIKNCKIINWGDNLTEMNAGIFAEKTANHLVVDNNYFHGDTFGLWLDASKNAIIKNNKVKGNPEIRSQDRGNGIHLYNVTNTLVENNEVWYTRDGIYIDTSNHNQLIGNYLHELRYGIHYMYSYSNLVKDNRTFKTRTAYALMQSKYLTVVNNTSKDDTNYGILMNYISYSTIKNNKIFSVKQLQGPGGTQYVQGAEGKALFMYNAPFNEVSGNLVKDNEIAIHLTAGSEGNKIHGNYFISNRRQVKYVANREVEWSLDGKGNYWSDYQGWDRNNDGVGDEPFEPNDGIDKVLWKYPTANILINSPALQTLRWVQKEFPVLKSPGIKDSFPLMQNDFDKQVNTTTKLEHQE